MELAREIQESPAAQKMRRDFERDGYQVEFWATGPGACLMGLHLEADGILYLDSGHAALVTGKHVLELTAGDQVLLPAGAGFRIENRGPGTLSWLTARRRPDIHLVR
jgi:mannose-6-phosphate isomerase-like protein (cupin superfamily)